MASALSAIAVLLALPAGQGCVVVRDAAAGQDVKIEAYGTNAVRVRAVPTGGSFKDSPDVISGLVPPATHDASGAQADCASVALSSAGQSVTSGNLKASVGSDGTLSFTRVSDGKLLLSEKEVRKLAPTTTTPPVSGFLSLGHGIQ